MNFIPKNIKALKHNHKLSCPGLNMWARGTKEAKQVYYLKYRLNGTQRLIKIGTFSDRSDKDRNLLTPIDAQAKAQDIITDAKAGLDYFERKQDKDNTKGMALRDKLKEFFEEILFTEEQRELGAKLVWMKDKNRLTYFPEKAGKAAVRKGKLLGTARKKDGTPTKAEPSYKNWKMSKENPKRYPHIDRDHYWAYVGVFNNYIASGKRQYKAGGERKLLLKNMPYNKITGDPWKHLHQDITKAKSAYIANDTLQMLRVFYNWLIEPKQHNDPKMRDVENPISDALSTPTKGPIKLKVEDPKGGKWHKQEPPEELESLTDKQTNMLILTIERSLIADPKKRADRMHNRNVLSILFNLVTGARPDVAEHLTWTDIANAKKNRVVSKGRKKFKLNITYCNDWVFERIKKLKSKEPGHPYVFASWKADGITQTGISDISTKQKKIFKAAGIPEDIKYYRLKHTAANFIYNATQDADYTAECLGISTKVLIERYLRSSNKEALAKKAEVAFNELVAKATQGEKGLKVVG